MNKPVRAAVLITALAACSTWLMPPTASAAPTTVECVAQTSAARPSWYHRRDVGAAPSDTEVARVQRELARSSARARRDDVTGDIVIPVRAHIVRSTHRHDVHATRAQVRAQIAHLNVAYSGGEDPGVAADTHFRFRLRSITVSRNDAWYGIAEPGRTANRMKKALHQGQRYTLNLYFLGLVRSDGLLGYTTFPWRDRAQPQLDGVVIAAKSVPGGGLAHYDEGDTAVHEVGHWLGLFHPFQGGCDGPGDEVADTPAEAEPDFDCVDQDSCPDQPGTDPIHNFMNYSPDSCMDQFTPDQATRMLQAWTMYRRPALG